MISHVQIPTELSEHPLLIGNLVYSLPRELLSRVVKEVQSDRFDPDRLVLENKLAESLSPPWIGFWNGRVIRNTWLAPLLRPLTEFDLREGERAGWTDEQMQSSRESSGTMERKLESMRAPVLGYAGWLLTNKRFLQDHDDLLKRHVASVAQYGLPRMGAVGNSSALPLDEGWADPKGRTKVVEWEAVCSEMARRQPELNDPSSSNEANQMRDNQDPIVAFTKEFEEFYIQWRLQDMDAPYAPNPLVPQLPVWHLPAVLGHMKEGGRTYYFPDTYPVPSREQLRSLIEDSLRPSAAVTDHLSEWQRLVNSTQTARNQVTRYARLHLLQHFVRQLYRRHGDALRGAKSRLYLALGEHFSVGPQSIGDDMSFISDRLGSGWEEEVRAY